MSISSEPENYDTIQSLSQVETVTTANDPDDMNLYNFEMVDGEFFAQLKEPAFTINVKRVYVNTACVRMLPDVDFVQFLISREEKKLVLKPCDESAISGFKWVRIKDGKRVPTQRTGLPFVLSICQLMGWNPDSRIQIHGKKLKSNGEPILVFDLTSKKEFKKASTADGTETDRRTAILSGWNGKFGPTYGESKRSLQVDTFKSFTVFSVKDGETVENTPLLSAGVNNYDGKRIDT